MNETMQETTVKKRRTKRWAFPLGLLIALLSVIGAVTIIVSGVRTVGTLIDRSRNYEEYNVMLTPVVQNDPDTFDDISQANPAQLIDISIWAILKSDLNPDQYAYSDAGMLIPEADVTAKFHELFGTEAQPQHVSTEGYGYEFTYDAAQRQYTIPLTGIVPIYTPRVTDVQKKSSTLVLTVGYLAGDQWAQNENGDMVAPQPDKYMKVTLRRGADGYYISAIQATSEPEGVRPAK